MGRRCGRFAEMKYKIVVPGMKMEWSQEKLCDRQAYLG
jgi:hypothetical protein